VYVRVRHCTKRWMPGGSGRFLRNLVDCELRLSKKRKGVCTEFSYPPFQQTHTFRVLQILLHKALDVRRFPNISQKSCRLIT
jgi:hypothetical protein